MEMVYRKVVGRGHVTIPKSERIAKKIEVGDYIDVTFGKVKKKLSNEQKGVDEK